MNSSDEPIILEQTFNSSIESVWDSITNIDQMRQWYFENIPAFKPEIGFETQFNVQSSDRNFLHIWKVTEVQPLKMIKYSWVFKDYPGKSTVNFELFKQNNLTKLKLTVDVLEDFPEDIPEFTRESCIESWKYFINNRLKDFFKNQIAYNKLIKPTRELFMKMFLYYNRIQDDRYEFDWAISIFRFNVELFPKSANSYDCLAEAYLKSGDKENAINFYKQALKVDPNFKNAQKMLIELE